MIAPPVEMFELGLTLGVPASLPASIAHVRRSDAPDHAGHPSEPMTQVYRRFCFPFFFDCRDLKGDDRSFHAWKEYIHYLDQHYMIRQGSCPYEYERVQYPYELYGLTSRSARSGPPSMRLNSKPGGGLCPPYPSPRRPRRPSGARRFVFRDLAGEE